MRIEERRLEEIRPYENNPRKNEPAVDKVAESLKMFGWQQPIVVDAAGVIIAGHTRLLAAQRLGMTTAPVVVAKDLTPEQVKAYRLADNRTNEFALWDDSLLSEELFGIQNIDMNLFGFDMDAIADNAADVQEDDYEPDPPRNPVTKPGDIYELGNHRLICGDATEQADLLQIVNRGGSDLLLTDPPYNVNYEGAAGAIKNDNMENAEFRRFLVSALRTADVCMRPGAAFYIWHADSEGYNFRGACEDVGFQVRQCLIWNKNSLVLGRQDYQWKHEPCLYGWKAGRAHYFVDARTESTVISDKEEINPKRMKKDELIRLVETMLADQISTTVINEDRPSRSEDHPTMKPIRLMARAVQNSSKPGWTVLDPFGGSGSTLIACEQLGRRCRMAELDPRYCDVIVDRWETFTGGKAKKI